MIIVAIGGTYYRVADPDWTNPLDPSHAAMRDGQRWNPPGLATLYVNADRATARSNVARLFKGLPYGPEDLDPATAPLLVHVDVPEGRAADAYSDEGLSELGLPTTYPSDEAGGEVPHSRCQPIGKAIFDAGLNGVDCRSAARSGGRELAWYPRSASPTEQSRERFVDWW
jgi:hypothetical protein